MRQLKAGRGPRRGLTLIELMVALAVMSLLMVAAAPSFSDYGINSRLRESGNALLSETLFAQSEAIKRNSAVRVVTAGATVIVMDLAEPLNPVVLRTRTLSAGVSAAAGTVTFGTQGWPVNLAAVAINLSHATAACSSDFRCPGLRVDAGGAVRLCGNYLVNCV